jgi:hypothetical protein
MIMIMIMMTTTTTTTMTSTFRDSQGILSFYIGLSNSLKADFVSLSAMKVIIMLNVVMPPVS